MESIAIAPVTRAEIPLLAAARCEAGSRCFALLAGRDGRPLAAVLAATVFSTTRGGAGLFATDLWVAKAARGQGLARRLLARTLQQGAHRNAGHFLKLAVYQDNPAARAAYGRPGFCASGNEANMTLAGAAPKTLKETV